MPAAYNSAPELAKQFINSPLPTVIINTEFRITWANDTFKKLTATNVPESIHIASLIEIDPIEDKTFWHFCNHRPFTFEGDGYIKTPDAITKEVHLHFSPVLNNKGKPSLYIVYADDITSIKRMFLRQMFRGLLEASKLKDNDTGNHIERVNAYSRLLAQILHTRRPDMGVNFDFIENIGFLAAMHDVGKIGVPDDILNKEGALDEREWEIMREHTINGAFILSSYPHPMAREIAISHHEKWDGSGYPYGLTSEMIPLSARIVSLADVYDALRMKRSYKKGFSHLKAKKIIESSAGSHLDPLIVEMFLLIHEDFKEIYNSLTDDKSKAVELTDPF